MDGGFGIANLLLEALHGAYGTAEREGISKSMSGTMEISSELRAGRAVSLVTAILGGLQVERVGLRALLYGVAARSDVDQW